MLRPGLATAALLLSSISVSWPAPAGAVVRRCVMPGGNVVHTDRSCSSIGAVEQSRHDPGPAFPSRLYYGSCARTLPDLVYELTSAIDSRDVNRLAASYHWPGLSGSVANATMNRLDELAARPLLDLRIVTTDVTPAAPPDDPFAIPEVRVRPTGLRVEQVLPDGNAQVTTMLGLHRHMDCWWVRL
ncbi:MAG TPA: hypothetical protein VFS99_08185 [Xanthomonadaceae bacterium]|nr:hypothetical protein [Xanthomonadaceae bacterium]